MCQNGTKNLTEEIKRAKTRAQQDHAATVRLPADRQFSEIPVERDDDSLTRFFGIANTEDDVPPSAERQLPQVQSWHLLYRAARMSSGQARSALAGRSAMIYIERG